MGRIKFETIEKLEEFFKSIPSEAVIKCSLCRETLTHIVKRAEVETGAGTATATKHLAGLINETAAPGDRVSAEALRQRVLERSGEKIRICSNGTNNPPSAGEADSGRKQTKPETKIQLKEVVGEIKNNSVSDDDLKIVGDALADAISEGKAAPRVATKAASAVKKAFKKNHKPEPKEIDNFYRLSRHALSLQEGLQIWADGNMPEPTSPDEREYAKIIRAASTSIITNYARLGIDVIGIYETFFKGDKQNGNDRKKIRL